MNRLLAPSTLTLTFALLSACLFGCGNDDRRGEDRKSVV